MVLFCKVWRLQVGKDLKVEELFKSLYKKYYLCQSLPKRKLGARGDLQGKKGREGVKSSDEIGSCGKLGRSFIKQWEVCGDT